MSKQTKPKGGPTTPVKTGINPEAVEPKDVVTVRDGKESRKKGDSKSSPATNPQAPESKEADAPKEELVVFAFRLTPDERELIHRAAGPARASRFVRALAIAAACEDRKALDTLLENVKLARGE